MQFNSAEALKARQWDEKMFERQVVLDNTAYQRKVADLKASGINPMMLAQGGPGATTPGSPGGPSASTSPMHESFSDISEGIYRGVTSAAATMRLDKEKAIAGQQIQNMQLEGLNLAENAKQTAAQTNRLKEETLKIEIENWYKEHGKKAYMSEKVLEDLRNKAEQKFVPYDGYIKRGAQLLAPIAGVLGFGWGAGLFGKKVGGSAKEAVKKLSDEGKLRKIFEPSYKKIEIPKTPAGYGRNGKEWVNP